MGFNETELNIIQRNRPELRFLPSNMDILVMEFLRIYDVNVSPTEVGSWNGWDTISVLDSFLNRSRGGTSVASAIFYSNRSMQISQNSKQNAEDWTTWKKWALDHEEFAEFKSKRIKEIEAYNDLILEKINSKELKDELDKLVNENVKKETFIKSYGSKKPLLYGSFTAFYLIVVAPILTLFTGYFSFPAILGLLFWGTCLSLILIEKVIPENYLKSLSKK